MVEIGYKIFDENWQCRGYQYKLREIFELKENEELILCDSGFHYWISEKRCLEYLFNMTNPEAHRMAKVVALGNIVSWENSGFYYDIDEEKRATDKILILEEIDIKKAVEKYNIGKANFGMCNVGNGNKGCKNTGDDNRGTKNSGSGNKGDCNSGCNNEGTDNTGSFNNGHTNSGWYNTGSYNCGNSNIGNYNTGCSNYGTRNSGNNNYGDSNAGDFNIGDSNIGMFNIADFGGGFFNTEPHVFCFNKPVKLNELKKYEKIINNLANIVVRCYIKNNLHTSEMTKKEYVEKFKQEFSNY